MDLQKIKPVILLAGATGYLGKYIAAELERQQYKSILLTRNVQKLADIESRNSKIIETEVTQPKTLKGLFDGAETVVSTVGITRQKDGLTYMDVDYQANLNLLNEAQNAGIKKFIYISAINGQKYRNLKIFEAKERFVDELKLSGLDYTIIRPNGYFSDMGDFLSMAKSGKVYLFGHGNFKMNPIHGADLAKVCVKAIKSNEKEINVGGPDIFSQNEIAVLALKAWSKPLKIIHLSDWIRKVLIWLVRTFTSVKTYGPIEFFLTLMGDDQIAPTYGEHHLEDFYIEEVRKQKNGF
ncbi:MAG TPA: SDR family oxidoreductase [Draconibacterium sp.]|nr:SDR family oxidoreductase [Draconibacterium sp.]